MSDDTADLDARFGPRAARPMAEMFDHVSGRYELLNRLLSLGQDTAWRQAMWREVPESARVVLDLCTGDGSSLPGLRRAGRLVIGADVSLGMLEVAADEQRTTGWGPRLLCADAFQLPLGEACLDAITIAFGIRNLRPRASALAEIGRVLKPGGMLVVLEAVAPGRGAFAPFHRFYLERLVPAAGRLSPDPSAYHYLAQSVLEFGPGPEFEADLLAAGFAIERRRSFLLGATRLWSARRATPGGQIAVVSPNAVQTARQSSVLVSQRERDWRTWSMIQALLAASLVASLAWAGWSLANSGDRLPLPGWTRGAAWLLIGFGVLAFGLRTLVLVRRLLAPRGRS